jgi:hypothetical protein
MTRDFAPLIAAGACLVFAAFVALAAWCAVNIDPRDQRSPFKREASPWLSAVALAAFIAMLAVPILAHR